MALSAPCADAGEYTVYSCRADENGGNASWTPSATSSHVTAYSKGCGTADGALVARAAVEPAGSLAPALGAALWRFEAPAGTSISQVAISGLLFRFGGTPWGVGLSNEDGDYLLGGMSGDELTWRSDGWTVIQAAGSTSLNFGVFCANSAGCSTSSTGQAGSGYARARADLFGARVRVRDANPPSLARVRGSLVSGSWVSGVAPVGFDAADAAGVSRQSLSTSGLSRDDRKSCDFTRTVPCPARSSSDFQIDTRELSDGERAVTLTSVDTAGNPASWTGTARIDNNAPSAPSQPELQGSPATQWRASNAFTLAYENPSRGAGAPFTSHDTQVCPAASDGTVDPTACALSNRSGSPGTDTVSVAGPGRFRFRVRINDTLHTGAWSSWSSLLRFDDQAPGTPLAAFPPGWVNAADAGDGLALHPPPGAGNPLSGISGYLIAGADRTSWVAASSSGVANFPYSLIPQGPSGLSVTAVSGSGMETAPSAAAAGTIRKDTIPPSLSVIGAPPPGSTVSYVVTITAVGQDSVSGMKGAPQGRPATDGGFVSFLSPGGSQSLFRGAAGRLSPGEGSHSISIVATDAAGNTSPEAHAAYTQDTKPPGGGLLPADADAPSRIRFLVSESCAGRVAIDISNSPGNWEELPTAFADGIASSRVPADIWDRETPYTLRAQVTDCAGNQATLDRWAAGPRAGLPVGELKPPERRRTVIRALVQKPSRSRASTAHTPVVRARVRDPDGASVAGVRVAFESQPRTAGARWSTIGSASTSRTGEASHSLPGRYSQRIRVTIAGNDRFAPSESNLLKTSVGASSSISARPTALRNGRRLTLSGRLRGGHVPEGLELTLYGRAPGSRSWVPVRSPVPVSRTGRWRTTYRFTRTRARTAYRFRVRIPTRPDYPFSSGYSPSKRVIVRP